MNDPETGRAGTRTRIIEVAARQLRAGGAARLTTRGVAEEAGVQPPTLYRLFGDKDGLLEAVAEYLMADYVSAKVRAAASAPEVDPVEELHTSWHAQIAFAVAHPAVFALLSEPDRVVRSPAAAAGRSVLAARVHRIAMSGRLRVDEERAVDLIHAAGTGVIQTLLATPVERRDPGLPAAMMQAVCAQILTDTGEADGHSTSALLVAVRALAPRLDGLSEAERGLLAEWLSRAVRVSDRPEPPAAPG